MRDFLLFYGPQGRERLFGSAMEEWDGRRATGERNARAKADWGSGQRTAGATECKWTDNRVPCSYPCADRPT